MSTWLNLLTWSTSRATHLSEAVENLHLEAHPVSGELELFGDDDEEDGEVGKVWFRRLDAETLQARCSVQEHGIAVVWVWCRDDSGATGLESLQGGDAVDAESKDAWKVAEVLALQDADEDREHWYESIREADDASGRYPMRNKEEEENTPWNRHPENGQHPQVIPIPTFTTTTAADAGDEVDDEDDYWASYDRTPIRTPLAHKPTPTIPGATSSSHHRTTSEQDYFARYGAEVQPALDAHDPDEEIDSSALDSTLRTGDEAPQSNGTVDHYDAHQAGVAAVEYPGFRNPRHQTHDGQPQPPSQVQARIQSPTPSRPSSPGKSNDNSDLARLEASASSSSAAELGVKQHISMEIKSLFRLARGCGIEPEEFSRVVRTELDVLGVLEL